MRLHKVASVIMLLGLMARPATSWAAEFYFGTNADTLDVDSPVEVGVFLSTEGQTVSAVEGKIVFPSELLQLQEVRDGNSILNFWLEEPHEQDGAIVFSGVTPGGFTSDNALLFTLVFQTAAAAGQAVLTSQDARVLLNDGQGTAAPERTSDLSLQIQPGGSREAVDQPADTEAPEPFLPEIIQDPSIFGGAYAVVFATQDKGTGVRGYEVKERLPWWLPAGWLRKTGWVTAVSPYRLQDQSRKSVVTVKAEDRAGNIRLATLKPTSAFLRNDEFKKWSILVLFISFTLVLSLCIGGGSLWRRLSGKKSPR